MGFNPCSCGDTMVRTHQGPGPPHPRRGGPPPLERALASINAQVRARARDLDGSGRSLEHLGLEHLGLEHLDLVRRGPRTPLRGWGPGPPSHTPPFGQCAQVRAGARDLDDAGHGSGGSNSSTHPTCATYCFSRRATARNSAVNRTCGSSRYTRSPQTAQGTLSTVIVCRPFALTRPGPFGRSHRAGPTRAAAATTPETHLQSAGGRPLAVAAHHPRATRGLTSLTAQRRAVGHAAAGTPDSRTHR